MTDRHLFPSAILESTTQHLLARQNRAPQVIYVAILVSVIALIASLPFLVVDVTVKSAGMLKATTEVSILKSPATGYVNHVMIKENQAVEKGQVLFSVVTPVLLEKEKYFVARLKEVNELKKDIYKLLNEAADFPGVNHLVTGFYQQAYSDFHQKLMDRQVRLLKVTRDYERNKKLYDQQVIAAAEFENYQFEFNKAVSELEVLKQTQFTQWQQELRQHQKEVSDMENQLAQVRKEIENLDIKAPVSGAIQNLAGIYAGSTVFAGQELAQISPDGALLAEVYVSPNDIGLLREGMAVRMQVGAFNYNQWGLLHGEIREISNDIQVMDNRPVFEVKCSIEQDHLTLKNGYQGKLKKGMTLQARFVVTRRSLWQLLYDKADDWLNPNILKPAPTK
jgi:HlyD family secretion protein